MRQSCRFQEGIVLQKSSLYIMSVRGKVRIGEEVNQSVRTVKVRPMRTSRERTFEIYPQIL